MAEIINLRMARKAKARDAAEKQAAENRVKFGQSKAEKTMRKAEDTRASKAHEAGKLTEDSKLTEADKRDSSEH